MSVGVVHVHLSARDLLGGQQTTLGMQASSAIYYFFFICVSMYVISNAMIYMSRSEGNLQESRRSSPGYQAEPFCHPTLLIFVFFGGHSFSLGCTQSALIQPGWLISDH